MSRNAPVARRLTTLDGVVLRGVRPLGGEPVDVRIDAGRISSMTPPGAAPEPATIMDTEGLVLLPGLVDLHTHLREPGGEESETIASGSRAAAAGGYSDVFAMANTAPVTDTADRVRQVLNQAAATAACRVHAVGAITTGLWGAGLAPIREMAAAGAGVFSDDGKCVDDVSLVRDALNLAAELGVVIAQHAQDSRLAGGAQINAGLAARTSGLTPWPSVAEEVVIARDVILAGETGGALHICHVSTRGSAEVVRWAKSRGWPVTAEVTPHHLLLTDELAALGDPRYKVNPPLRAAEDVYALREALVDGTIDAVATDHAPHTAERKSGHWCEAAFGMTGLETALAVVAHALTESGKLDWPLVAAVMAHAPARIGGIADRAGRPLAPGEPATFCLVDPDADHTVDPALHHSMSANTPFAGFKLRHTIAATAVDGHLTHATSAFATKIERSHR